MRGRLFRIFVGIIGINSVPLKELVVVFKVVLVIVLTFENFFYILKCQHQRLSSLQPQHLGFALHQNVTFAIEGIKLTAFHKNDTLTNIIMDNPINFFIEWKAESLDEMTERWHHVPTNTEAISYYDRVENGITLEDVRKWYYNWCNN